MQISYAEMSMETRRSFRGLLVWQLAMDLAESSYFLTRELPREELFGLTSQIRRAVFSIPANIAEGTGRGTRRDFVNFLRIAQGSLRELETYLLLTVRIRLLDQRRVTPVLNQVYSVARLLNRLIQSLRNPPTER